MTVYKTFYELLGDFANLFDTEQKQGAHEVAMVLREISNRSHTPLPPAKSPLSDMVLTALRTDPHPLADKVASIAHVLDWHYTDHRVHMDVARHMVSCELVGPDGMIFHDGIRVGLFAQSAEVSDVSHAYAAEETLIMLGGHAMWSRNGETATPRHSGDIIHHPSMAPRNSVTHEHPFIALWRWSGNIDFKTYELTG